MKYFIDHKQARIHERLFAGDQCAFIGTPAADREFTDSDVYVKQLKKEKNYVKCPHCSELHSSARQLPASTKN